MSNMLQPETEHLKDELSALLVTLKNNRDKVPLPVLKTKYKKGYGELCQKISRTASDYAKQISLYDIRVHQNYLDEGVLVINNAITESGLLKELSKAAFCRQDIEEFTRLAFLLREKITVALEPFYGKHTGLYITAKCLENPDILPELYCLANGCIWHEGRWVPLEQLYPSSAGNNKHVILQSA